MIQFDHCAYFSDGLVQPHQLVSIQVWYENSPQKSIGEFGSLTAVDCFPFEKGGPF